MAAVGARLLALPEPAHDGLQDGGERRHSNACCDENGVLRAEHVARRSSEGAVNIDLRSNVNVVDWAHLSTVILLSKGSSSSSPSVGHFCRRQSAS